MARRRPPQVAGGHLLLTDAAEPPIAVGSPEWYAWLDNPSHPSFAYPSAAGLVTLRRERRRNGWYWYAFCTRAGRLRKAYLGRPADISAARIEAVAGALGQPADETAQPPELRLHLFGPGQFLCDGRAVALGASKARALLAYLAAAQRPLPREQIQALLWPESDAAAARKNLRNLLWRLRAELGPAVAGADARLALHPRVWSDLRALEQARRAVEDERAEPAALEACRSVRRLYSGDLLEGLTLDDAPEFELWLAGARERYHDLYQRALRRLVAAYRAGHRWREVADTARAALHSDPLQEPMHRALIEAHARQGDRAAALRQYELLRGTLDRELGVGPLPETEQLHQDLLNGRIAAEPPPDDDRPRPAGSPARLPHADVRAGAGHPFVGRVGDLDALDAAWGQACAGQARAVLISGEAGIGKSRLWQTWAGGRPGGAAPPTTLAARCLPTSRHLPFAPLVDMLRSPASRRHLASQARPSPPAWLADVARVAPDLVDTLPALPALAPLPPAEERRRVFEALVRSLGASPQRPLALFVDDLHWADRATLDWLGYLLHRQHDQPLLLVGAYRSDELPPALEALIGEWLREGRASLLPLARLSRVESATLVTALGGDTTRADTLHDQSAGNPFFLIELLRAAPGAVPPALTSLIEQRLARLAPATRQLLQAAAVLHEEISFSLIQHTSGRTEAETLDALDDALANGLLVEDDGYSFSHPLIADVVDGRLSGARRAVLHRRAAAALERLYAGRLPEVAGRLARHWGESGDRERAAQAAELAGQRALSLGAPVEAAHFFEQALGWQPTPARHHGLGLARYRGLGLASDPQADMADVQAALLSALDGYEQAADRHAAARVCLDLAQTALATTRLSDVERWVQRGRSYLGDDAHPSIQALAAYLLGAELRATSKSLDQAAEHLCRARTLVLAGAEPPLLTLILIELGNVYAQQGRLADAVDAYRELVHHARAAGNDVYEVLGHNNLAYHALLLGDYATAQSAIEVGLARAEERGTRLAFQWLYSTRGELALAQRQWQQAEHWLRRAMAEAEQIGNTAHVATTLSNLARAASGRGDLDSALDLLERARATVAALPGAFQRIQVDLWLADLRAARGQHDQARAALARAEALLQSSQFGGLQAWADRLREQWRAAREASG